MIDRSREPPATDAQRALIRKLKHPATTEPLTLRDFDGREIGRVECLTTRHLGDRALIERFVRWRNQYRLGWLDQRPVTVEGTTAWVEKVLADDRRLNRLFYAGDTLVGRGGMLDLTAHSLMSDGIVRGERGGGMHFMHFVNFTCMGWDFEHLGLHAMDSKVLATNALALRSTGALGYREHGSVPMYVEAHPTGVVLTEREGSVVADQRLWYLRTTRPDFERARQRAWASRDFEQGPVNETQ